MYLFSVFYGGPSDDELRKIDSERIDDLDLTDKGIENLVEVTKEETVKINNEPIAYCKAQEELEGAKTHGEGIKESDREISIGAEKIIPTNDFRGI